MFGRVLILFVAAAIALSTAACAFADFADLRLIRVYYDRNGTEVATDLGDVHTLVQTAQSGGSTTLGGAFTGLTANLTTFAVYFALDRSTGVNDLWATGKVGVTHTILGGSTGLTSLKSGSSSMYALYNANATDGGTEYTGAAAATSSYKNKISATQGFMGNAINTASRVNTEASLAGVIGSGTGSAVQALYFWDNALTTVAAGKTGVQVATITTNADGSTVISPPPAPATVPAAPTIGTATVTGDGKVSVTFTPGSDGGSPIIGNGYKVTSYPGSITGTGNQSPITVLGLINGTSYNFTVTATNSVGTSDPSEASNSVTPTVPQAIDAVTFSPATLAAGGSTTASATATSGLTVSFSSQTPEICSVTGTTVTGIKVGTCTVAANQAGGSGFDPAPQVLQDITVAQGSQTIGAITFTPATLAVSGVATASATGGGSGNPVAFSSTTPEVCSVDGATVTGIRAGTCTIAANQAGSADYQAAAEVTENLTVEKGAQSIVSFSFTPNEVNVGDSTTASATASSGLAVGFSSETPEICSVTGNSVTILTSGTCTVTASQPGGDDYLPASGQMSISAGMAGQAITFDAAPSLTVGGSATVSATGGASGNPVTFGSSTPAVCSVDGSTVTGLLVGTCSIAANQAGSSSYNPATQVTQNIAVGKGTQSIGAIGFTPAALAVGDTTTVSATGGASGNPVTFGSATPEVCEVNGTTVTALVAGTCTIAANQAGNTDYEAATERTQDIAVAKGAQTIGAIGFSPATLAVGGATTVSATGGASGNPVIFGSATPDVCSVNGATVTALTAGTCTIAANQAGNDNYQAATQTTQNITVNKGAQSIGAIGLSPATLAVGGTTTVSATGGASGNAVTFGSSTPDVCSVNGATVTALTAGTCSIAANQAGNSNYNPATQVTQSITIGKGAQSIGAIGFSPATLAVGGVTTAGAAGGASGNPVTYGSATPDVCSVDGASVTALTAGSCTIAANQAGNADYEAAIQVTQSIAVGKGEQSIESFSFSTNTVKVGDSTTVSATATSGLPLSFNSATPDVCSLTGSTATFLTTGMCMITAMQPGDDNYHAAGGVLSITAERAGQTIAFGAPPTLVVGKSAPLSATGGASGNPVSFSSATPELCSVSGSTVSALAAGTCAIAAGQAGNDDYEAATQATQSFTVTKATQSIGVLSFSPETLLVNGTATVTASAGSGLAVAFASATPEVCSVSGSTVTPLAVGNCTITADQSGNEAYSAAPQTTRTLAVGATVPGVPGEATATAGNGVALISFAAPGFDGGSAILGYTVTSSPGGFSATGSAGPITVAGLANGTSYTFTVTARNSIGSGPQSLPSAGVTPATLPGAPNIGTATAADARATVVFTAPAFDGGSAITGYTVTSHPAGGVDLDAGSGSLTHAVTGLSNGTSYTFTVTAANAVGSGSVSAHSNGVTPATVPGAPVIDNVTAGNATAAVTFSAPAWTGGSAVKSYTVTAAPGGMTATGNAGPLTVTGLANGTAYTFTVTATNAVGSGPPSPPSDSVTPATVPGAPSAVSATAGDGVASVAFTAPSSDGGSAITGYTVTANPGDLTGTGTSGPITVSGLDNGTAYTFTVTATNATGTGTSSAASNRVTPALPLATFAVTPAAGANGAIAPATVQSASVGSSISFTVTPAAGYQIAAVSGCGGTLSDSTFTTGALTGDCQVNATFVALPALKGDLNGDDEIDLHDALLALQFAVGMRTPGADELATGDVAPIVNGASAPDRRINIADAVAILRRTVDDKLTW